MICRGVIQIFSFSKSKIYVKDEVFVVVMFYRELIFAGTHFFVSSLLLDGMSKVR